MSTDRKGTRILARTFFNQLRSGGYTPNQIIEIASELIELVTVDLRESEKMVPSAEDGQSQPARPF